MLNFKELEEKENEVSSLKRVQECMKKVSPDNKEVKSVVNSVFGVLMRRDTTIIEKLLSTNDILHAATTIDIRFNGDIEENYHADYDFYDGSGKYDFWINAYAVGYKCAVEISFFLSDFYQISNDEESEYNFLSKCYLNILTRD